MSGAAIGRCSALATLAFSVVLTVIVSGGAAALEEQDSDDVPRPDVVMEDAESADFTDRAADLPPDLVEAIERDLDLSPEQYLARAAAAKSAADVVASLGDTISAAWLEDTTLHVVVKDRDDKAAVAATGAEVHAGDALTDAVEAALKQDRLAYADRREGNVVPVEAEFKRGPDRTNQQSSQGDGEIAGTIHGGFGYWTVDALFRYRCTAGFNGVGADGGLRTLTAGHCQEGESDLLADVIGVLGSTLALNESPSPDTDDDAHAGDEPGFGFDDEHLDDPDENGDPDAFAEFVTESARFGGGHDIAMLAVADGSWTLSSRVAAGVDGPAQGDGVAVYDAIAPVVGAPVCSSGVTSGWTCGTILDDAMTAPVDGEDVSGFLLDACTLPGDGGGPVMTGNYAVGISSGSTWDSGDCARGDAEEPPVAVAYPLVGRRSVDSSFGDEWSLSVHVGAPEVTAPVDGDVTGPEPTVRGRVDAAAGATVLVSIDGAEPVEALVRPDGTWRAPVTESLAPGHYQYSVTVQHTAATAEEATVSEAVTGTFDVAEVASLVVLQPSSGQTVTSASPTFAGTGDPGARIRLDFDGEITTTVVASDGTWEINPRDMPRGGRFDAVIMQETDAGSADASIERLGIVPSAPLILGPGGEVGPADVISGSGIPDSTVAVRVQQIETEAARSPETDPASPRPRERIGKTDEDGHWEVELGNLAPGVYKATAVQAIDDLTSERSAAVTFEVMAGSSRDLRSAELKDENLAETGGPSPVLPVAAGVALAGAGAWALAWRRRRGAAEA